MCDRPAMLRAWNRAAAAVNRRDPAARVPLWSDELLNLVTPLR
jgi:hypothetical protein